MNSGRSRERSSTKSRSMSSRRSMPTRVAESRSTSSWSPMRAHRAEIWKRSSSTLSVRFCSDIFYKDRIIRKFLFCVSEVYDSDDNGFISRAEIRGVLTGMLDMLWVFDFRFVYGSVKPDFDKLYFDGFGICCIWCTKKSYRYLKYLSKCGINGNNLF